MKQQDKKRIYHLIQSMVAEKLGYQQIENGTVYWRGNICKHSDNKDFAAGGLFLVLKKL